jgi:glycosyltransferase involved in cell wall biosynthesis
MSRICVMTTGQPSINPRLVKEADALAEVGHQVHVLCAHTVSWADEADKALLSSRRWTCSYVGGEPRSLLHYWTRLRHRAVRCCLAAWKARDGLGHRALCRVTPELLAGAARCEADLYIAHYTGALAAAVPAAKKNRCLVAFDAEDFESGYYHDDNGPGPIDVLIENLERDYLPACCYVTAASPGIAAAYSTKYSIPMPTSILNVFSLAERPQQFRATDSKGPMRLYWFSQTVGLGRGLEDVIRAMGKLRDCEIELHLRGLARPDHWRHLRDLASSNGLNPRAIVLHAPAAPGEMISAAAEFDVGLALEQPVSLNRDLCLTNKIFSYLLAGNAIAATSTTGQQPIIEAIGRAGFLYEPGDVNALAKGLHSWSYDRQELGRARSEAWSWGTRQYNWDIEKKKLLDVVGDVLNKARVC